MYKVLLVEDEQLIARMFQKTLESDGLSVEMAKNGAEGLAKMETWQPDIVLMDMMMPEMNGIETLHAIQANEKLRKIPVVILTNLSADHDAELATKSGAVAYWVKKNVNPTTFAQDVRALVEKQRAKAKAA